MNEGIYSGATALTARLQAQDLISRNLANSSSHGYRKERASFIGFGTALYNAQNGQSDEPSGVSGVEMGPITRSQAEGELIKTDRETDVAIRGPGFFLMENASGEQLLTREGHFDIDKDEQFVSSSGFVVQSQNGAFRLPGRGSVTIQRDGWVTSNGRRFGQFKLVMPKDLNSLEAVGTKYFKVKNPEDLVPVDMSDVTITAGFLEGSNVNMSAELVAMISNSRTTEASSKALEMIDEGLGSAIRNFGA